MKNFSSVEGLRAWMAWWVVLGHGIYLSGTPSFVPSFLIRLFGQVDVAVNVFIVVSGFVITHLLQQKRESYGRYIVRRFFRLYPVYVFCLFFAVATVDFYQFAYIDLPFAPGSEARLDRLAQTEAHFWAHFLAHLTMLHGVIPSSILPYADSSFLAPAWSLSLEWQFYLLAPLLVPALLGGVSRYLVIFLCLLSYYFGARWLSVFYQYKSMLLLALPLFLVGILSRFLLARLVEDRRFAWLCAALVSVFFVFYKLEALIWGLWLLFLSNEVGFFGGHWLGRVVSVVCHAVASNKFISRLGRWSYSTYLVHIPIFCLGSYVAFNVFGLPVSRVMAQWVLLLTGLCLPIVSWLMYEWIERPGINVGARVSASIG